MRSPAMLDSRFIGRVLRDKWRIDSKIARGGMGTVFVARHKNNGSVAAIKILNAEFARDEDTKSRFMQEGYAANQVNHPGVVRILDDDVTEDGFAYLVMELLEGELLEQRRIRKGGRLALDEVYAIADQLLDVLAAAHAKGIVHRDIKPDNLFITRDNKLKVLDFGFAQVKSSSRKEQTATGFLIGTPGFMAPEQAMGSRGLVDAQTDIWAVGATMFLLITGEPCHPGESPAEMLAQAANFAVRSITTLEPRLPTKLAQAIDRALAFKKADRWPDARSMQAALRAIPGRPPRREAPPRRSFAEIPVPPEDSTLSDEFQYVDDGDLDRTDERIAPVPATDVDLSPRMDDPSEDEDGRTVFVRRSSPEIELPAAAEPPTLSKTGAPSHPSFDDDHHDGTVVMDNRPFVGRASIPDAYPPPGAPYSMGPPGSQPYSAGPRASSPMFPVGVQATLQGPASTNMGPAAAGGARSGSRLLTFVLVAGITMIIVILTGLLIIVGSD